MAITDASGLPIAAHIESASPHEVKLVEATLDSRFIDKAPEKLIGDKAYDSDKLDKNIAESHGVEILPHTEEIVQNREPRMDENLGVIGADRKVRDFLRGFKISGDWLLGTNTRQIIFWP